MDTVDDLRDSLVQASFTVIAALSRVAAEHDLSLTQLRMLGILRDREPAMAELATYLGAGALDGQRTYRSRRAAWVGAKDERCRGRPFGAGQPHCRRRSGLATRVIGRDRRALAPLTDRLNSSDQKRLSALLAKLLDH